MDLAVVVKLPVVCPVPVGLEPAEVLKPGQRDAGIVEVVAAEAIAEYYELVNTNAGQADQASFMSLCQTLGCGSSSSLDDSLIIPP